VVIPGRVSQAQSAFGLAAAQKRDRSQLAVRGDRERQVQSGPDGLNGRLMLAP